MPLYEFQCEHCGEVYEQLIRSDDKPKCKNCGETTKQNKQLTSASFTFRDPKITDISQVPEYRG